jgi:hypothetical protein
MSTLLKPLFQKEKRVYNGEERQWVQMIKEVDGFVRDSLTKHGLRDEVYN